MKLTTKVSFKEYAKLMFRLAYSRTIMKILVSVAIILLLWIILYYLNIFNLPKPIIYQYITLLLIVVVEPIVIYIILWRNYRSSNYLRETLYLEINPNEIEITGESFCMQVKLERFFKIVEKDKWFLLYQNTLSAIIIPKKDMTENDISELKKWLADLKKPPVELLEDQVRKG